MTSELIETVALSTERDVVTARQAVRRHSLQMGFSLVDQTKLVTAASELARNAVTYGGGGRMECERCVNGIRKALRLSFIDEGPGIPSMELAMKDGWTSGSGLGMGLSGAKRLVNEFEIESEVGRGTRVVIARWI